VEPASVIGLEFERPAIESLAPQAVRPAIDEHLSTLTRKHFIRLARSGPTGSVYRFHHHLVRGHGVQRLLKRTRAQLHIGFVRWADQVNADRDRAAEFQEILGYHLEQAFQYLRELGPLDPDGRSVGVDAAARLAGAGRRAFARSDMHAASNLLRRAAALLGEDPAGQLALLPQLGEALLELGEFAKAREVLDEAAASAQSLGNERLGVSARLIRMFVSCNSGEPGDWGAQALSLAEQAIPVLERSNSNDELAIAWRLIGFVHGVGASMSVPTRHAVTIWPMRARPAMPPGGAQRHGPGHRRDARPTAVPTAIAECEHAIADDLINRQVRAVIMCVVAQLRAMNGEFEEARRL